ncbi:MAG: UDP-4-amino-4,6-dideoxy-N-acetyl-beta-L-altrosamine transaminase [Candidatus Electrothrix sp. AUS1_2]|nr:UDP-4-amino-4,6-dideoxy-N-acetyl-beta-L-altrosamine transaminase [Candidatus Electrothrix sp. AUS1_2]
MKKIPYGKQVVDEQDIVAVCDVLRSDWLTTGPAVAEFERAVRRYVGAEHGVAVSSGTAALHCAMYAINIGEYDEVIVPTMTFAATANSVVFQKGRPVFADVDPDTLLIDPECVEKLITPKTKAIIAVDYAGQPCDYDALRSIADSNNLILLADSCHALGAKYQGRYLGSLADITVFSFHPVKHITTGEGGMAVTDNAELAARMRLFRNHGISTDFREREKQASWHYEMIDLGFNYRLSDIQCALGMSQLKKLPSFLDRRERIASLYNELLAGFQSVKPLAVGRDIHHAWHLYVVKVRDAEFRQAVFNELRSIGIGVNVHYIPVHLHPYYQKNHSTGKGLCPVAEKEYQRIFSLPIWPGMDDEDVQAVVRNIPNM